MTLFPDVPEVTYRNDDDMYHCCRWCKHYRDGVCKEIEVEDYSSFEMFIEDGSVSEVVKESFSDMKFTRFQDFLKSNTRLSEKMVHEAMYRIHSDLDQAKEEWVEEIIQNLFTFFFNNKESYFVPPDENTFYCNRWE